MNLNKKRLLFFDVIRIFAIFLVVMYHLYIYPFSSRIKVPYFGDIHIGGIGVILFVFISGAILEYTYKNNDVLSFYINRVCRLYPAYWISLVLGAFTLQSRLIYQNLYLLIGEITGMTIYMNVDPNHTLNPVGWFIGMIVVLYLLFPFISKIMSEKTIFWALMLISFSLLFRAYFYSVFIPPHNFYMRIWYESPLSNLAFFVLGMLIIKIGYYPKMEYSFRPLAFASELSFYVFLTHHLLNSIWTYSPILYVAVTIMASVLLMGADTLIQRIIRMFLDKVSLGTKI